MDIGTALLWLSLLFAVGTLACSFFLWATKKVIYRNLAIFSTVFCMLALTGAYIVLTKYFLDDNFDIHYVWGHSGTNLAWYLKFSGVWAGQEGSLLLWVWIIIIPYAIYDLFRFIKTRREEEDYDDDSDDEYETTFNVHDWTRVIIIGVTLLFFLLLLLHDPFEATHTYEVTYNNGSTGTVDPSTMPGGQGMNPMLRNMWMVIHPPLLFIGYALITIPFAASLAYSITGDRNWSKISLQWSRLAWLFLTLGIGIGALWAYVALGWGGYWAWDPVEVGSLIPWITLTAFMHAQIKNQKKKEYRILTPILGTATLVLVIFATYITRSGEWFSVHAWAETEVGRILLASMAIISIFSALIILRAFLITLAENREYQSYKFIPEKWESWLMFLAVITLIIITIITFYALYSTRSGINPGLFEAWLAPITFILVIVLSICLGWKLFGKENLGYLIAWLLIAGVACAILLPGRLFPGTEEKFLFDNTTDHDIIGFLVPFIIIGAIASLYKIIKALRMKSKINAFRKISAHIIHLSVVFIIIAYAASQTMAEDKKEQLNESQTLEMNEYKVKVIDIEIIEDTGNIDSNEYWDTWYATIEVYKNDVLIKEDKMEITYRYNYNQQGQRYYSMIMSSTVLVDSQLGEDLYINFKGINDDTIELEVQTIPLMPLLWAGMWLMMIGIIIRMAVDFIPRRRKERADYEDLDESEDDLDLGEPDMVRDIKRPSRATAVPRRSRTGKTDEDYEKMLEEELKNL
jgi:cytochrome c-type biogenesis protein CcmF